MGVIYKLREEVIHFIISQRQSNPLASCRQLAESASQKFGLHLSKSSVHDVLRQAGIITPRGRKPNPKFEIPQEKKKQIQVSLSRVNVKYLSPPYFTVIPAKAGPHTGHSQELGIQDMDKMDPRWSLPPNVFIGGGDDTGPIEISPEYEGAGGIFLKAALWDLGIFSEENIKATDRDYYLTYSKGIKVVLENNKSFFIDLPLPLERCIREVADGLINNVKPFIVHKVSDEGLFKACMGAQAGFKIDSILIVDYKDHILLELSNIMESNRKFILQNRAFVESHEINLRERSKALFFQFQNAQIGHFDTGKILNLKGFDTTNKDENVVTLLIDDSYENKAILQGAAERLNGMYLYDEQGRLVSVKIAVSS